MPYLPTSELWLQQSTLLLSAHPTTTRITTKYHTSAPSSRKARKPPNPTTLTATSTSTANPTPSAAGAAQQQRPTADLTLKTYDPTSGACLKYRTDKAAEVGRLVGALGRAGGVMSSGGVGFADEEEREEEVMVKEEEEEEEKRVEDAAAVVPGGKEAGKGKGQGKGAAGGGGGGGKKKKGKR